MRKIRRLKQPYRRASVFPVGHADAFPIWYAMSAVFCVLYAFSAIGCMVETAFSVWYKSSMTGKQRAYLKSLASTSETILQVGKEGLTPECTASIAEALAARELVKIGILQNYDGDLEELARTAAERTRSQLIQVIGRKFVLYKEGRDEKKRIILPPAGKKS